MAIQSDSIHSSCLIDWTGIKNIVGTNRPYQIKKASEIDLQSLSDRFNSYDLEINVGLFALFPLLVTNGENLFGRVDQAIKDYGNGDHKK